MPRLLCHFFITTISWMALTACTPHYNWRQVGDANKTFTVLLPGKPAVFTRNIALGNIHVAMTMTAAKVDDITFAVGMFTLPDTLTADTVLAFMAQALTQNIAGTPIQAFPSMPRTGNTSQDIAIKGTHQGKPAQLIARLLVHNSHVYQVLILATDNTIDAELAETFLDSFIPQSPLPE